MVSYKQQQKLKTSQEVTRMRLSGMTQLSLVDYISYYKSEYGICIKIKHEQTLKYYNTANSNSYLECTLAPLDKQGVSIFNIKSLWWEQELNKNTELATKFRLDRLNIFTTLNTGHILAI